jgi:hypothetical protein
MVRVIAIAALCYLILHFALHALQIHAIQPLQYALIRDLAPVLLVFPIHGLRVLCAWYFGLWSVVIMAPTALLLFAMHLIDPGHDPLSLTHLAIKATFLFSAPASFWIIRACLARPDDHMALEWRVIMLVGLLSGLINVLVIGLLQPPSADGQEIMVWLLSMLVGYMAGVFLLLLLILMALRVTKRVIRRFM